MPCGYRNDEWQWRGDCTFIFYFFEVTLFDSVLNIESSGTARKIEEYVPEIIPTIRASTKSLIESIPMK